MHFEWWGITVGLNSTNINLLAGTPSRDFRAVLSNIFPNNGTAINIVSTGIYTLIRNLERIHTGNGVWIKILYNYKSLRWGLQVRQWSSSLNLITFTINTVFNKEVIENPLDDWGKLFIFLIIFLFFVFPHIFSWLFFLFKSVFNFSLAIC
jgi:hypothetical protein